MKSRPKFPARLRSRSAGQIVVEYLLLLVIGVVISSIIIGKLASRNTDNPGAIIKAWHNMLEYIGRDDSGGSGSLNN